MKFEIGDGVRIGPFTEKTVWMGEFKRLLVTSKPLFGEVVKIDPCDDQLSIRVRIHSGSTFHDIWFPGSALKKIGSDKSKMLDIGGF